MLGIKDSRELFYISIWSAETENFIPKKINQFMQTSFYPIAGVLIRRKKSDMNPLQQVFVPPILSAQTPTKFIIEVANSMYREMF